MNITLDQEQIASLQELASAQGQTVETVIHDAVDAYLQEHSQRRAAVAQLDDALERLRSRLPKEISDEEIDRDITEARAEYWAEVRAARGG